MIGRGLRGPDIGGTKDVEIVTYKLQFGDPSEDTTSVQTVDDLLLEAFGKHAKKRSARLKVKPPGGGSTITKMLASRDNSNGDDPASRQRRQGPMLIREIQRRKSCRLDGKVFDIVVKSDSGTEAYSCKGVQHPWRVLINQYDKGRKGRKYRFIVTGRDK